MACTQRKVNVNIVKVFQWRAAHTGRVAEVAALATFTVTGTPTQYAVETRGDRFARRFE